MTDSPCHVSIIAIPESLVGPVTGMYEGFDALGALGTSVDATPAEPPFHPEIVGADPTVTCAANGLSIPVHRPFRDIERTDIVIAPSMMVAQGEWVPGRQPELVEWMRAMHGNGAGLCGACSGALLVAETGLLDGREATVHPAFASTFQRNFPEVQLSLASVLVTTGPRGDLITSGAASAWHDLLLYLVARHAGPAIARELARFMLFQWHEDGQGPYITFAPPMEHGDAAIRRVQVWLANHYAGEAALEDMHRVAGLSRTTFRRRFRTATGYTPITYLQNLRIEQAKSCLERTDKPVDEVGGICGYENPAFFRRLFKRLTGVSPGTYRRRFKVPEFGGARPLVQ